MILILKIIFLIQLILTLTGEVYSQEVPSLSRKKTALTKEQPIQISADHIIQGTDKNSIHAWGRVKLKFKGRILWADKVTVNNKTGIGKARGHVILVTSDGTRMKARESLFDLKSKKGKLYKTKGTIADQFYIKGKSMERLSTNHFILDDATLTTCEGVLPAWKIEAKTSDIVRGDRALFEDAIIKIKNIPILYLPMGYIPINRKRKTGFLFPTYGIDTNAKGFDGISFHQDFFWAINRWSDATIYTSRILEGWRHGLNYRYIPSNKMRGAIAGNIYKDSITGSSLWSMNMYHAQEFPNKIKFRGTLALASERNLNQIVNNNIEERTRRNSDSYAVVNKLWDNSSLDVIARYKQSLDNNTDDTLGELPKITYKVQSTQIGETPFYYNLETSSAWFVTDLDQEKNSDFFFKTSRLDFRPKLSIPIPITSWFSMQQTIGARETFYGRGLRIDYEPGGQYGAFKKLPNFTRESLDFETNFKGPMFNKIYNFNKSSAKIKHLLGPSIAYSYIPDIDEKDRLKIKAFDHIDNISPANSVSYAFEQRLLKKMEISPLNFETKQILRFTVSQAYDIREATAEKNSGEDRLPFSDLRFDLDSRPLESIILNIDSTYNFDTDIVKTLNFEAGVKPVNNLWIIMERRWAKNSSNYILGTIDLSFDPGWRLQYSTRFDELTSTFRENNFSLLYDNPCKCWGFKFDIIDRQIRDIDNDRKDQTQYLFTIKLRGLGELKKGSGGKFLHRDFDDTHFPDTKFESKLMY